MVQQEFCQGCDLKNKCKDAYERLGSAKTSSVARKVVVAFLLPLVVFIGILAASDKLLAKLLNPKGLRAAVSLLSALAATFAFILIAKAVERRFGKNK